MANYKLITFAPTASATSQLAFTAGGTNTVVTSVVASDSSTSTLEVLVKKNGGSIIELAHSQVQTDKPEELLTAPVALEALDELYVRTSRTGAQFVISYVEETTTPNDTALGGLIDVDTTGVSDGDSLVYNVSNSQWEPSAITGGGGGGSTTLDGLTDTAISSPVSGNLLRWNGSNWVNASATTSIIVEGTNLYYTDTRVDARIAADTTKADASHQHLHTDITDFDTEVNALIAAHPDLGEDNVNADWNAVSGDAQILNKPALFSGAYADLTGKPSIPADLDDLSNVSSTAPSTGEVLKWNGSEWAPATDASGSGGGAVDSVNTQTGTVVLDADDIDDASTTHKFATQAELDKVGHISVTQAVDLDAMETSVGSNTAIATAALGAANTASQNLNSHLSSIENHSDVSFSFTSVNRPNNAFIVWDDVTGRWEDGTISIDRCSDVDTTTTAPSTGDVLEWDGSNFVPAAPSGGGGGTNVHDTDSTFTNAGDYDAGADIMDFDTTALTMSAGKPYALSSTGWAVVSNADSSSLAMIAVCSSDATDGSSMVIRGLVRASDSLSGNVGDPVYLGTGSKWTMTAPTSNATVVQLGRLIDATNNVVWFDPDKTTLTLQ